MESVIGLIFGILMGALFSGGIIWIVGKMNVGLSVDHFGWAVLAGLFIGAITNLVMHFVPERGGFIGATVTLVVSAAVILLAGQALKGVHVKRYSGALIAAIALASINLVLALIFGSAAMSSG